MEILLREIDKYNRHLNTRGIYYALISAVLALFLGTSCNKENAPDCVKSAGEFKTVKRTIDPFTVVELRDYLQIELYDSAAYFVEITAPENLIPEIETNVHDGKLKIENMNTCNFVRSYKKRITVRIYSPSFSDIQNYSTGNITAINTLHGAVIKIENRNAAGTINLKVDADTVIASTHTGVCDVFVSGHTDVTRLFNQGLGIIDARNLQTTDAFVNNSSINDVYVNTNGYFFALIEFSGNIFYTGTPNHIDSDIVGDGKLTHIQ